MQKDGKPQRKVYLHKNVLQAAQERIAWLFDRYSTIVVSVSGGKDSTVTFELAWRHARSIGRDVHVFFLDQEVEYASTIETIVDIFDRPNVVCHWWQTPFKTTNATSYSDPLLHVWEPGVEWMRAKDPRSFQEPLPIPRLAENRATFYHVVEHAERMWGEDAAILIGLRSEESLNRYGAVTRNPAVPDIKWSSKSTGKAVKFYPIYDWTFEDIWTYIGNEKVNYNRAYDWMYVKGFRIPEMRVSHLIHEKAFRCLPTLHEFEPDTYERLIRRIAGIHVAARYADESLIFDSKKLPQAFSNWLDYRDFLLSTLPLEVRQPFLDRFSKQKHSVSVYKQQVKQVLINDQENFVPVINMPDREDTRKKWMEIL